MIWREGVVKRRRRRRIVCFSNSRPLEFVSPLPCPGWVEIEWAGNKTLTLYNIIPRCFPAPKGGDTVTQYRRGVRFYPRRGPPPLYTMGERVRECVASCKGCATFSNKLLREIPKRFPSTKKCHVCRELIINFLQYTPQRVFSLSLTINITDNNNSSISINQRARNTRKITLQLIRINSTWSTKRFPIFG